jgi:hypothetical protein
VFNGWNKNGVLDDPDEIALFTSRAQSSRANSGPTGTKDTLATRFGSAVSDLSRGFI